MLLLCGYIPIFCQPRAHPLPLQRFSLRILVRRHSPPHLRPALPLRRAKIITEEREIRRRSRRIPLLLFRNLLNAVSRHHPLRTHLLLLRMQPRSYHFARCPAANESGKRRACANGTAVGSAASTETAAPRQLRREDYVALTAAQRTAALQAVPRAPRGTDSADLTEGSGAANGPRDATRTTEAAAFARNTEAARGVWLETVTSHAGGRACVRYISESFEMTVLSSVISSGFFIRVTTDADAAQSYSPTTRLFPFCLSVAVCVSHKRANGEVLSSFPHAVAARRVVVDVLLLIPFWTHLSLLRFLSPSAYYCCCSSVPSLVHLS